MTQTRFESVTGRFVVMAVSTLAGIAAFGWVLATYQPSTLDLLRESQEDFDLAREVSEYRSRAQTAAYDLDFKTAVQDQQSVVDLEPYKPENWLRLADYHEGAGSETKARNARSKAASVQHALAKDIGSDASAWRRAALLLHAYGKQRDAKRAYEKAAEVYLDNAKRTDSSLDWSSAADILTDLGRINEAREAYLGAGAAAERELKLMYAPRSRADAAFWRAAGEYYIKAGDLTRATAVLLDAVSALRMAADGPRGASVPNRNDQWDLLIWSGYHLGWVYHRLGEHDKAQEAWERSLRTLERRVNMPERRGGPEWYNRACLRSLTGDREGAIEALEQAVRSKPVSRQHALADEDLRSLHDDERFHALVSLLDDAPTQRPWR